MLNAFFAAGGRESTARQHAQLYCLLASAMRAAHAYQKKTHRTQPEEVTQAPPPHTHTMWFFKAATKNGWLDGLSLTP